MRVIAHRGNVNGAKPSLENQRHYIDRALKEGHDAEIDVWKIGDKFFLGHDRPDLEVPMLWIADRKDNLWIHCKNLAALIHFTNTNFNAFWHENDRFTMTTKGWIWTNIGEPVCKNSVVVALDLKDLTQVTGNEYAICTDHADLLKGI